MENYVTRPGIDVTFVAVGFAVDLAQNTREKRLSANPRLDVCRRPSCQGFSPTEPVARIVEWN